MYSDANITENIVCAVYCEATVIIPYGIISMCKLLLLRVEQDCFCSCFQRKNELKLRHNTKQQAMILLAKEIVWIH